MPNAQMVLNSQELSSMDSDVLISTTTVMSTTPSLNITLPEDMVFNAGHQLSIVVYRFGLNDEKPFEHVKLTRSFVFVYVVF